MTAWKSLVQDLDQRAQDWEVMHLEASLSEARRSEYQSWAPRAMVACLDVLESLLRVNCADCLRPGALGLERTVVSDQNRVLRRVLQLSLGPDTVDLHTQQEEGQRPTLHLLLTRVRAGRVMRLVTLPGGWLRPESTPVGFSIRSFEPEDTPVELEQLAQTACRLLAAGV